MKKIFVQLICRHCLYRTHKESETLILPDIEKDIKKALLEETYFTARCPQCGHIIEFLHPCLYVDKKHNYMLYIKSKKDWNYDDHLKFDDEITRRRYVFEYKKIAEKIRIFDDGFDDCVMELLKLKLISHLMIKHDIIDNVIYRDVDLNTKTLWFDVNINQIEQQVAVMCSSYVSTQNQFVKDINEAFIEIDESWAKRVVDHK